MNFHPYYLVYYNVAVAGTKHPYFATCARTAHGFVRIENMHQFLSDGKSGLSGEVFPPESEFIFIGGAEWAKVLALRML